MHVLLGRNTFELTGTLMSGLQVWQKTFSFDQRVVARDVRQQAMGEMLEAKLMQSTQDLIMVGSIGVISPAATLWDGKLRSSSEVYQNKKQ